MYLTMKVSLIVMNTHTLFIYIDLSKENDLRDVCL